LIKYCATKTLVQLEGLQVFRWGVLAPPPKLFFPGHTKKTLQLSDHFRFNGGYSRGYVPGMHGAQYKHGPLIPHQFIIINLILFICGYI